MSFPRARGSLLVPIQDVPGHSGPARTGAWRAVSRTKSGLEGSGRQSAERWREYSPDHQAARRRTLVCAPRWVR